MEFGVTHGFPCQRGLPAPASAASGYLHTYVGIPSQLSRSRTYDQCRDRAAAGFSLHCFSLANPTFLINTCFL